MIRKRLLLHTCCAPCVVVPVERMADQYDITCFFFNPNIQPAEEYRRRLAELERIRDRLMVEVIIPPYDADQWLELVRGLEGEPEGGRRCAVCFRMRLEATAQAAIAGQFDFITTTLTVSPHKNAELINQIGQQIGETYGVAFLEENFKKKDGYKRSIELSKAYQLYRQDYCGCIFSQSQRR
ncbi:MAG: epoxyqueuosine reductase QueH [candidate division KSB1 bacterium]|nr:epoxyqueuosine reductase QueH [candidate division KSB1 bacterium]MDZ7317900.1 epoxyqueuosine reductase QueH [candidate division KSB1 bacterium]MDZ7339892.1 epoxyqueuosine reductase QueH [candidate division KSB1 bacterium]